MRRRAGRAPPPVECGDLPFLIRRDGTWLYRGIADRPEGAGLPVRQRAARAPMTAASGCRPPPSAAGSRSRTAPFVAVELDWRGDGPDQVLSFRTNIDQVVTAGAEHPIRIAHDILTCEPTPYILLRPGEGRWPVEARINRAVYYELVALAVPGMVHCRADAGRLELPALLPPGRAAAGEG